MKTTTIDEYTVTYSTDCDNITITEGTKTVYMAQNGRLLFSYLTYDTFKVIWATIYTS